MKRNVSLAESLLKERVHSPDNGEGDIIIQVQDISVTVTWVPNTYLNQKIYFEGNQVADQTWSITYGCSGSKECGFHETKDIATDRLQLPHTGDVSVLYSQERQEEEDDTR